MLLNTHTESLSYISTCFSPLGLAFVFVHVFLYWIIVIKRKKRKKLKLKKSQAIKLEKDRQRNGDALEFFFLSVLGFGPALFEEMHFQDEMSF